MKQAEVEQWRKIVESDDYSVSSIGRVRRDTGPAAGKILRTRLDTKGYPILIVRVGGKKLTRRVHRLMLQSFVGVRPRGYVAAHNNGVRHDKTLSNLRWTTQAENLADRILHGTLPLRHEHWSARYTLETVEVAKSMWKSGRTRAEISEATGIPTGSLSKICRGQYREVSKNRVAARSLCESKP